MTRTISLFSGGILVGAAVMLSVSLAGGAHAGVIYDATGGDPTFHGGDVIDPNAPGMVGVGPVVADRFFNPVATPLSSVTFNLMLNSPAVIGNGFTVDLWLDST